MIFISSFSANVINLLFCRNCLILEIFNRKVAFSIQNFSMNQGQLLSFLFIKFKGNISHDVLSKIKNHLSCRSDDLLCE